jgi:hypothetical protein
MALKVAAVAALGRAAANRQMLQVVYPVHPAWSLRIVKGGGV